MHPYPWTLCVPFRQTPISVSELLDLPAMDAIGTEVAMKWHQTCLYWWPIFAMKCTQTLNFVSTLSEEKSLHSDALMWRKQREPMKSENKKAPVNDPLKSSHMFDHNQIIRKHSFFKIGKRKRKNASISSIGPTTCFAVKLNLSHNSCSSFKIPFLLLWRFSIEINTLGGFCRNETIFFNPTQF